MSKIKVRCTTCGKWFQSANVKEGTCPECVQKARKEKLAAKAAPPPVAPKTPGQGLPGTGHSTRSTTIPPKAKPTAGSTNHWLDAVRDVKVSEPEPPPQRPKLPPSPSPRETYGGRGPGGGYHDERAPGQGGYKGPGSYRDERPSESGGYRGPGAYHNAPLSGSIVGGISQRPRQPSEGGLPGRGLRPGGPERSYVGGSPRVGKPPQGQKKPRPAPAPKPKKEKIPPPEPFKPTPEQIAQVEARYLELAVPTEFDGIRSQISHELAIPKRAIKQIVKALREREQIPSWWETQVYKGDEEEKEKIKLAYEPHLPVPAVGVHRQIADELDLKPGIVYQAIKTIRNEMKLPPYNDPELHAAEFAEIKRQAREAREAKEAALAALASVPEPAQAETQNTPVDDKSNTETQTAPSTDTGEASAEAQETPTMTADGEHEKAAE